MFLKIVRYDVGVNGDRIAKHTQATYGSLSVGTTDLVKIHRSVVGTLTHLKWRKFQTACKSLIYLYTVAQNGD